MPQIIHSGGLAKPVWRHELAKLLNDIADQFVVSSFSFISSEAKRKSVEVEYDELSGLLRKHS